MPPVALLDAVHDAGWVSVTYALSAASNVACRRCACPRTHARIREAALSQVAMKEQEEAAGDAAKKKQEQEVRPHESICTSALR